VEDRKARSDLLREAEQVELGAEFAVVALGGLLELHQVRLQVLARRPGRAIDALQLGILLAATPVRGGRAHQLERWDPLRGG
jgi:hypothetical protein